MSEVLMRVIAVENDSVFVVIPGYMDKVAINVPFHIFEEAKVKIPIVGRYYLAYVRMDLNFPNWEDL